MKRKVISFEKVNVTYANGFCAAREVSFAIEEAECLAIVGESGSGKTTLARAALGLLPPAMAKISGSILVGETEIVGASNRTLRSLRGLVVGFVAQNPFAACNPLARVGAHVAEAWRVHGCEPPENSIVSLLERLGIENALLRAQKYPHQWSGGMLQRATIAAASAHEPTLIIADEPTSALDRNRADSILTALRLNNRAILLISHDLELVARHADRIAVCLKGQIIEINTAAEILKNPQHHYTKKLLAAAQILGTNQSQFPKSNEEVVLEAKNLSKIYGRGETAVGAVKSADLQVRRGEIVGIYGASGSGKSTLLRLLATMEMPSKGSVSFAGEAVTSGTSRKLSSRQARGGFVMPIFQDPVGSLDRRWAIWRSVTEPLFAKHHQKRFSNEERRAIARQRLTEVGLEMIDVDAKPGVLSVGQCQRVCIARAFVAEPALILADEPTSALDASIAAEIVELFAAAANRGIAVVVVSHDEKMLASLCHRVLKMSDGELVN